MDVSSIREEIASIEDDTSIFATETEILAQESQDFEVDEETAGNKRGTILHVFAGSFHHFKEKISLKNTTITALWDFWFHGSEANQDELIPPFRFIPNTDFEGSDIRKAKGAMRFLLLEVGKLKILKRGHRIIELDYHAETNLRDTAIMNAYKHARSVRTVVAPDTLNKNPSKNITSLSFQTFYEHCSIDKLQQKYLAEHHIEPEF